MVVRTLSRELIIVFLSFVEYRGKPESQLGKEKQQTPDENEGDHGRCRHPSCGDEYLRGKKYYQSAVQCDLQRCLSIFD
jgi:hypothetical protein